MSLISLWFPALVLISAVIYYLVPKRRRWLVLLAASFVFYLWGGIGQAVYIVITSVSTYLCGLWLQRIRDKNEAARVKKLRRPVVFLACLINFGMLFAIKYWDLALDMAGLRLPRLGLAAPLGLSFFIFQSIGYVADVARGKVKAERNLLKFSLFVSFFPQITEGPIGRYGALAPQLYDGNDLDFENIRSGLQLSMWGLIKKLVIAERAGVIVAKVYSTGGAYDGAVIAFAVLMYCVQLYCDFSGGVDIARGAAKCFGIDMAENFKRPIFAKTLTEYWRRWHISLGAWLRDYVFYPLTFTKLFNRIGKLTRKHIGGTLGRIIPTSLATFIIYFLVGIWHGANYTYIAFGLYNGLLITSGLLMAPAFEKLRTRLKIGPKTRWFSAFSMGRTMLIVFIGRYITRAPYLKMALIMLKRTVADFHISALFSGVIQSLGMTGLDLIVVAAGVILINAVELIEERGTDVRLALSKKSGFTQWVCMALPLAIIVIAALLSGDYTASSFIYAQF